jgi:hypothetical protein
MSHPLKLPRRVPEPLPADSLTQRLRPAVAAAPSLIVAFLRTVPILAILTILALSSGSARAQLRTLPADAYFGKVTAFQYPMVKIDSKHLRLSPGAKIYNQQNMIIMPPAMVQKAKVLYRTDLTGQVSGLWLLTPLEAERSERTARKLR